MKNILNQFQTRTHDAIQVRAVGNGIVWLHANYLAPFIVKTPCITVKWDKGQPCIFKKFLFTFDFDLNLNYV